MKTMEEELWEYIDGTCNPAECLEIQRKIDSDPIYQQSYSELMQVHQIISAEELDEPSMSFTRNVMEQVNAEIAPVALKTKVDHRIIYAIGGFFVLSLLAIFTYALMNSSYSMPEFKIPHLNLARAISPEATNLSLRAFLFLDLVLALVYFDRFIRKTITSK
jgi:hypothetical protein